jgi:type I restriction enzyme S subunit
MSITTSAFMRMPVPVPSREEQQKIADCLTSLDEVIAAQGRKVEALEAHKRGLMQQLFPREGETRPRLRFPEFRDAPDLEAKVLSELVKFSSGGTPSKAAPNYWGGDIPWISASSMHDMIIEDADQRVTKEAIGNGTRLARKGCILVLVRGSMLFKRVPICISTRDVAFNQDVKALAVLPDMVAMFLLYQLVAMSPRIPINETGIGAGKIETEVLENLEIWVPGIAEQQRIADCLSSLDTQITAETQQLIALKIHKQGLMQQLFPVPEAAGA